MMEKQTNNQLSEQELTSKAKRQLDQSVEALDQTTLIKLQAARRRALDKAKSPASNPAWWLPVGGLATAATVAVISVSLWTSNPTLQSVSPVIDDLALLTEAEELEFFEELEFYQWLEDAKDVS